MKTKTQNQALLAYLRKYKKGITTLEAAIRLGICRLSERVRELMKLGYSFIKLREKSANGATVTRYKLAR